jgi:hypothetical protein
MHGPSRSRWRSRLIAAIVVLGITALAVAVARCPDPAGGLVLCLPLWAALYAAFALLYAALEVPFCADLLDGHGRQEKPAGAAEMHEENRRPVVEEVVLRGRHLQPAGEGRVHRRAHAMPEYHGAEGEQP